MGFRYEPSGRLSRESLTDSGCLPPSARGGPAVPQCSRRRYSAPLYRGWPCALWTDAARATFRSGRVESSETENDSGDIPLLASGGFSWELSRNLCIPFVIVQHGVVTPFAPPLPEGCHLFAWTFRSGILGLGTDRRDDHRCWQSDHLGRRRFTVASIRVGGSDLLLGRPGPELLAIDDHPKRCGVGPNGGP